MSLPDFEVKISLQFIYLFSYLFTFSLAAHLFSYVCTIYLIICYLIYLFI
jgi:hypothetical protein